MEIGYKSVHTKQDVLKVTYKLTEAKNVKS
jgi:hypothetical protein